MQKQITGRIVVSVLLFALTIMTALPAFADSGAIPQRSQVEEKYKWDLTAFFPSDSAWEAAYTYLENNIPRLDQYKGKLATSANSLYNCLELRDSLELISDNLYVYAYLKLDEDNRASQYQELGGRAGDLSSKLNTAAAFMRPEILKINEDQLDTYLKENPGLKMYEFYLRDILRSKAHILSEKEEALLAMAGPVTAAPSRIFTMLDDADMSYGTITDTAGNEIELTKERYYKILESPNREMREKAARAYNEAYLKVENTLATTLGSSVQKDNFLRQARNYKTCLNMSLDGDSIPPDVFYNLISAVDSNLAPLHKWAKLRKQMLGLDTLHTYDLYVPLVSDYTREYPYEEAESMVLKGVAPLGDQYVSDLQKGLNSRWVDVYETEGKGSGGYTWGTYSAHPVVLMNYNNSLENVFTLAHEMGHAMHSFYTNRYEPYVYSNHYLFTAEVASTCNEALLMDYLLKNTTDKREKMFLLNKYIEQIIGTFYTQVMFSEFELAIHEQVENGGALSADFMRQTYRDIYQKFWGPELVIGDIYDLGGMRIPHFYREYYVFQYATSYSAALAISQRIREKDKGALDAYLRFLQLGSSEYPVDILKQAGVDMTTPEPINRTIDLFSRLVDQMEQLLNEG